MDVCHVTKLLLMTSLVLLVTSSPLPYGLKPYTQASDWENAINLQNDIERLRVLLSLQRAEHMGVEDSKPASGQAISKRFDFGFSGLDNIDHILTTLDRSEAMRPHASTLKQQFIANGASAADIEKLKKLMQSVG